jgi:peptidoglycan/LPS O-acetylase OafA/YrhL
MRRALPARPDTAHPLLGLEVLRFVCAVSVLVWHYQHFYFVGAQAVGFVASDQPLYGLLKPFYEAGWLGVQTFWCLSGFIFFWKYARPVADGAVPARHFAVLRFSRLYPLHLLTLLVVVVLGAAYRAQHGGADFVYSHNDVPHFLLQLAMASDWPGRSEWSFNGPIWSISIEILVYGLFYVLCRLGWTRPWQVLAMIAGAGVVYALKLTAHPVVLCVFFFYLGAATYQAHARWQGWPRAWQQAALMLAWLAGVAGTAALVAGVLRPMFYVALISPLSLLVLLDAVQPRSAAWARRINALGNTTYASYLLHFPLQLGCVTLAAALGWRLPVAQPLFLLGFLGLTFALATVAYRTLEMPAQRWLRRRLG